MKRNLQYTFVAPSCSINNFKPFPFVFGLDSASCNSNFELTGFAVDETTQAMLISAVINAACGTYYSGKRVMLAMLDSNALVQWIKYHQGDAAISGTT